MGGHRTLPQSNPEKTIEQKAINIEYCGINDNVTFFWAMGLRRSTTFSAK